MPADDEELAAIIRAYRLAARSILDRAEKAMTQPWLTSDFAMADSAWARWMRAHPEQVRLKAGDLSELAARFGQLPLEGVIPTRQRMTAKSPEWEQLRLALDGEQLSMWSEQALRAAESAQYQTSVATHTFLARYNAAAKGTKYLPVGVPPFTTTTEALRGVPGSEVWARPPSEFRIALFEGRPVTAARKLAAQRARALLGTDVQLAHVHASLRYLKERGERDNIVGYRRVPRGGRSCALCLLASTQRYHRGDLMPIHDHCHCVVEPIYGDRPPPQVIAPVQLKAVHARIEAATGSSDLSGGHYRDAVIVHHHGEIGPVLSFREHSFTGPSDLEASN